MTCRIRFDVVHPGSDAPAGTVVVTLKNRDADMPHLAQLMKLHDGVTVEQFTNALDSPAGVGAVAPMSDFAFAELDKIDWHDPVSVVNDGDQPHEMAVLAPVQGKSMDDVRTALDAPEGEAAGPPPYASFGGVAAIAPGKTQETTLKLDSGNYLLICFVVDPTTGKPHYMLGMEQEITVK